MLRLGLAIINGLCISALITKRRNCKFATHPFKVLRDKHFKGWAIFDVDGPRKGDDGFSIGGNLDLAMDDHLAHNINYLRDVLGVRLPPDG